MAAKPQKNSSWHLNGFPDGINSNIGSTVVVDSHIQRIVLATEETTVTQQVSHRPIKCQSRLWSQRGTKVNGSHHGDNPLLRPTGIQIATKSYAALQAMAPTNIKTVHQTSLLHIESNLNRLGMLSPTHDQRSQQKNGKITLQPDNTGEKPSVMLYTYIYRHAGTLDQNKNNSVVCVCVCVCFLPIHSGHQVRWTYQPGSHRRKVTQDFSSTFFLRCVP